MSSQQHPKAHALPTGPIVTKFRTTYEVRDPITGQALYFRDEKRAQSYAARIEIADALGELCHVEL